MGRTKSFVVAATFTALGVVFGANGSAAEENGAGDSEPVVTTPVHSESQETPFAAKTERKEITSCELGNLVVTSSACDSCDACVVGEESCLDNLSIFLGPDGARGPDDFGVNAHFGLHGGVNYGFPILDRVGLGGQIGIAGNYERSAVRVLESVDGTRERNQTFLTLGLFERTESGISVGLAYDFRWEQYYEGIDISQWRGQLAYDLGARDQIGIWGTKGDRGAQTNYAAAAFNVQAITQGNLFWQHIFRSGALVRGWVGLAEEHNEFVLVFTGDSPVRYMMTYGSDVFFPLNDYLAVIGQANFITPTDTGTVTAFLGFAFYPAGGVSRATQNRYRPMFMVANNPTFSADLEPRR